MVELSNEMLETYQMTLYKSLVFKDVEEALPTILNCLDADKKKAKKVKEVVAGGQIQSGYYQLPQLKEDVNRFILFKIGKRLGYPDLHRGRVGCRRSGNHVIYEKKLNIIRI